VDSTAQSDVAWLRALRPSERARFLAWLAHSLTVSGRALVLLPTSAESRLEKMRQLNEIQHRVCSYIGHVLGSDEDVGWLPIVARYVLESDDADVREASRWAWSRTRESFIPVP
jgi:hypothetical protein